MNPGRQLSHIRGLSVTRPGEIERRQRATVVSVETDLLNPSLLRQVMLVQRLPHEDFDYRLPADVEFACCNIEFLEHVLGEVDIHSLYGRHHPARVGEVTGNILATFRPFPNRLGR